MHTKQRKTEKDSWKEENRIDLRITEPFPIRTADTKKKQSKVMKDQRRIKKEIDCQQVSKGIWWKGLNWKGKVMSWRGKVISEQRIKKKTVCLQRTKEILEEI